MGKRMARNIPKRKTGEQTEKEKRELINWSKSYWLQAPLIAIVAIIPLIVYYHVYDTGLGGYEWFGGSDAQVDFYLYCKMFLLLIACGYMVLVLLFQHFFEDHKMIWDKRFIPLIIYAVLTILSTFFSISKYHSLHGIYQQFESIWVLLGYCVTAYYTFYLLRTEEAVRRLLLWFGIGAAVMAVLGMTQMLGVDFLQTKLGKILITPSGYDIKNLAFNIEKGRTYLTLENPNYVGSYVALLLPILLGLMPAADKLWKRAVCGGLSVLLLIILFASQSRGGIVALAAAAVVACVLLRGILVKHWKISVGVLVLRCRRDRRENQNGRSKRWSAMRLIILQSLRQLRCNW